MADERNLRTVTVKDIAAWALPHPEDAEKPEPLAVLPTLQRGPAWKPEQIERLWDSLVRGFPVGSFMVSPYGDRRELGDKGFALQGKEPSLLWRPGPDDWHLLDGQQRASAIALGFFNPWTNAEHQVEGLRYLLWVDLDPADEVDDRVFIFRLLTQSHPWGYRRIFPRSPLSATNRRQAAEEFEQATGETLKVGKLHLRAIPFDAQAPVPVSLLFQCLDEANPWVALRDKLYQVWPEGDGAETQTLQRAKQRHRVDALLSENPVSEHMARLVDGLRRLVSEDRNVVFRIPALIVPSNQLARPDPNKNIQREDPIATLFIRVNSAGTVPSQEELAYSLLKSEWPDCHQLVEALPHAFLPPAQMVAQFSSLILARSQNPSPEDERQRPPSFPDLRTFRRLVYRRVPECENFLDQLKDFLLTRRAMDVIEATGRIMLYNGAGDRPFRLLPAQGAQIARRSRRVFFLFLAWIDSHPDLQDQWLGLREAEHRRLLGAITALSWFGSHEEDCVAALWATRGFLHKSGTLGPASGVRDGRFGLIPLVPPQILRTVVQSRVSRIFEYADRDLWDEWRFWPNFVKDPEDVAEACDWYANPDNLPVEGTREDETQIRTQAWASFANRLTWLRDLLLFSQRDILFRWFPVFDPTSPERLEDIDQPWDFDHILPNAYKSARYVPRAIRDWQSSIGNLRAWPAELNRSDRAIPPAEKLCGSPLHEYSREFTVYKLDSSMRRLDASAITHEELQLWQEACPEGMKIDYLGHPENSDKRFKVLQVITGRLVRLYENWFNELHIADLAESGRSTDVVS